MTEDLSHFYFELHQQYLLKCIGSLLDWDLHTYIPPSGAAARAEQQGFLSELLQRRKTSPEFLSLVDRLSDNRDKLDEADAVNVRETKRRLDRTRKLSPEFVGKLSELESQSYAVWVEARPRNDYAAVKPYLERLVDMSRQKIDLIGYEEHPYDALLDDYEPYARLSEIKPLLMELGSEIKRLLPTMQERQQPLPAYAQTFPVERQQALCSQVAAALGYSFETGRLDASPHPFESRIGTRDVRITTRYDEQDYLSALYSTIHEVGHALYELGLPERHAGTPLGSSISLGIHESQSRLWENIIGRSAEFCRYLHRLLGDFFPEEHRRSSPEEIWRRINFIEPSLIRVEADEVTYSLHIIIRMLLEEALIMGELPVDSLPEAWASYYEQYLGIRPRDVRDGVMQDVHWFSGSFGYFPTYALGNLYGAQLYETARKTLPGLDAEIQSGNFQSLRRWLQKQVFDVGKRYSATELVQRVSGARAGTGAFIRYLEGKFLTGRA